MDFDPFWWEVAFPDWQKLIHSVGPEYLYIAEWTVIGTFCDFTFDYIVVETHRAVLNNHIDYRSRFMDQHTPEEFWDLLAAIATNDPFELQMAQHVANRIRGQSRRFINYMLNSIIPTVIKTHIMKHWKISFDKKTLVKNHGSTFEQIMSLNGYWDASLSE